MMGRRGPKRRLRLLDVAAEAARDLDAPPPPPEVVSVPEALAAWRTTVSSMKTLQIWADADAPLVARYAILSALHARYAAACLAGHDIMETKTGYKAPTPEATQLLKVGASMLALERALGLPAASRRDMPAPAGAGEEDLAVWLRDNAAG